MDFQISQMVGGERKLNDGEEVEVTSEPSSSPTTDNGEIIVLRKLLDTISRRTFFKTFENNLKK